MPDIIEGTTTLYEFKCKTPFKPTPALGLGSHTCGGAPSTADGHFIAMGNTEEDTIKKVLGLQAIGAPGEHAFDRMTGLGRVHAHEGDYADARRKRLFVFLVLVESTGAVCSRGVSLLRHLSKQVRRAGHRDGTVYGLARHSTRSFFTHHLTAMSSAAKRGDALILENSAASLSFLALSSPPPPRNVAPRSHELHDSA